jgi:hypothetical protein
MDWLFVLIFTIAVVESVILIIALIQFLKE